MSGTGDLERDVDRLLADCAPAIAEVARAVRALVQREVPGAVEKVDFGNRLIGLGWSMAMRDLLYAIIPHAGHVNLQLADGAELPDPAGIVEGTGKRIRHLKCRSLAEVERPAVAELVRAQAAIRPPARG